MDDRADPMWKVAPSVSRRLGWPTILSAFQETACSMGIS